ncbi:MAG: hypothetical protein J6I61_00950 [Prevotella sp.]|nr:hypothetical protein [Prevotella sp.]
MMIAIFDFSAKVQRSERKAKTFWAFPNVSFGNAKEEYSGNAKDVSFINLKWFRASQRETIRMKTYLIKPLFVIDL